MQPTKLNSKQIKAISERFYEKQHAKSLFELIAKHGSRTRYDLVGENKSINVSQEVKRINSRLEPCGYAVHSVRNPGDTEARYTLFKLDGGAK